MSFYNHVVDGIASDRFARYGTLIICPVLVFSFPLLLKELLKEIDFYIDW